MSEKYIRGVPKEDALKKKKYILAQQKKSCQSYFKQYYQVFATR